MINITLNDLWDLIAAPLGVNLNMFMAIKTHKHTYVKAFYFHRPLFVTGLNQLDSMG